MSELSETEEINLLPDRTGRSDKLARSNHKNWRKFVAASLGRPAWKRQLAGSHAGRAKARKKDK